MTDYDNCPIGIKNTSDIKHVKDSFQMAIERIEEKMDDLKTDMQEGFSKVNNRLDKLEKKFEQFDNSLPSKIDERLEQNKGKVAASAWKWVFTGVLGSVAVAVITALILRVI